MPDNPEERGQDGMTPEERHEKLLGEEKTLSLSREDTASFGPAQNFYSKEETQQDVPVSVQSTSDSKKE